MKQLRQVAPRLPGNYISQFRLKIDINKVCDDHYDSKCMKGRCPTCSINACSLKILN